MVVKDNIRRKGGGCIYVTCSGLRSSFPPPLIFFDCYHIFKLFDRDGSGTIDIQEMRAVLNELGKKVDNKELERLMNDLDNDGSGEIDFEEFLKGMERLDQLTAAPDVFQTSDDDPNNKGETVTKLQEDIKELKRQGRTWQTVHLFSFCFVTRSVFIFFV